MAKGGSKMYGTIYCDPIGFVAQQIQENLLEQAQIDHLGHQLMGSQNNPKKTKRSDRIELLINQTYYPQYILAKDI